MEKTCLHPQEDNITNFYNEIDWQTKHYGFKQTNKVMDYIKKQRINDFSEDIRPKAKVVMDAIRYVMSPVFEKYVREKYFSDMPYPRLF